MTTGGPLLAELIPAGGVGRSAPIALVVSQAVIRLPDGTPVCVVAEYGPSGAYAVSRVGDDDFDRILSALGLDVTTVETRTLSIPGAPAGHKLVAGPGRRYGG